MNDAMEVQTTRLEVTAAEGGDVEVRLERGEAGFAANAEQRGTRIATSDGADAVETLASCLAQVARMVGTDNIRSAQVSGYKLMGDAGFAKACRQAGIEIPASR
ncbi:hypothetical protein GCM10027040_18850 [Halomonas shantousis]